MIGCPRTVPHSAIGIWPGTVALVQAGRWYLVFSGVLSLRTLDRESGGVARCSTVQATADG